MQSSVEPRKTFTYTIRPAVEQDIPALVDFFNEINPLEGTTDTTSVGEATMWWNSPLFRTIFMLAFLENEDGSEGKLIGMAQMDKHPDDDVLWGDMLVHPDYRNNGVGTALYAEFERRAVQGDVNSIHINPSQRSTLLIEFLERRGFTLDRYFWEMRLPAEQLVAQPSLPGGITVRTFVPGQDEQLFTDVRNVTFAEHYGSVQRTVEEMSFFTEQEHFRPEGLFFAFDGDQIAGYCYTGMDPREWEREGEKIGHIHHLGVVPAYRGKGLGRALLLIGVNYLRQFVEAVHLGVEGKNANALALYESTGFHQHKGWTNMVKE